MQTVPTKGKNDKLLENKETDNRIIRRIIRRAYRNHPLSAEDKQFNRRHAGVRSIVERVFGQATLRDGKSALFGRSAQSCPLSSDVYGL
jgi:hypothetical protein